MLDIATQSSLYFGILLENQSFDQFINYHSKDGNYADHEIVMASCEAYNINIIVYELMKQKMIWRFLFANSNVKESFKDIPAIEVTPADKHYNLIPYA